MTRINLRVLVIDKLAFCIWRPFIIGKTKDDFFTKQESSHYLPIDKTNKMKAAKNSQSSTDYDRYFVLHL
jgi:hypothetical protein